MTFVVVLWLACSLAFALLLRRSDKRRRAVAYTLVLGDAGKVVAMNVAGANTLTMPPNSSFPIGTIIEVYEMGAADWADAMSAVDVVQPE